MAAPSRTARHNTLRKSSDTHGVAEECGSGPQTHQAAIPKKPCLCEGVRPPRVEITSRSRSL
jgi:hypothetical protein